MTHEELLAEIDLHESMSGTFGYQMGDALRAVVELHFNDYEMCGYCDWASYPCKTIEVIEKELK